MPPFPGTHVRVGPGHPGASQHQPAHEGCWAAFSFIKSRPGGRQMIYGAARYRPAASVPEGSSPACVPDQPRRAGHGGGQRGKKRLAHSGKTGSGSRRELPPQPGRKAEETGISMSQWGRGVVTRRTGQISTRNFVDFPAQGRAQKCKPRQ